MTSAQSASGAGRGPFRVQGGSANAYPIACGGAAACLIGSAQPLNRLLSAEPDGERVGNTPGRTQKLSVYKAIGLPPAEECSAVGVGSTEYRADMAKWRAMRIWLCPTYCQTYRRLLRGGFPRHLNGGGSAVSGVSSSDVSNAIASCWWSTRVAWSSPN